MCIGLKKCTHFFIVLIFLVSYRRHKEDQFTLNKRKRIINSLHHYVKKLTGHIHKSLRVSFPLLLNKRYSMFMALGVRFYVIILIALFPQMTIPIALAAPSCDEDERKPAARAPGQPTSTPPTSQNPTPLPYIVPGLPVAAAPDPSIVEFFIDCNIDEQHAILNSLESIELFSLSHELGRLSLMKLQRIQLLQSQINDDLYRQEVQERYNNTRRFQTETVWDDLCQHKVDGVKLVDGTLNAVRQLNDVRQAKCITNERRRNAAIKRTLRGFNRNLKNALLPNGNLSHINSGEMIRFRPEAALLIPLRNHIKMLYGHIEPDTLTHPLINIMNEAGSHFNVFAEHIGLPAFGQQYQTLFPTIPENIIALIEILEEYGLIDDIFALIRR